jgi:non-canonical purine NTP pyrophosphatase (RdgB/HAM1 family)
VHSLLDFPDAPDVAETGKTLTENALLKATQIAEFAQLPALADDSGIFIKALGWRPGIYSARYSGQGDAGNNSLVLAQLQQVAADNSGIDLTAEFRCAVVLAFPDGSHEPMIEIGVMPGQITFDPRGENGFGYDPLFIPTGKSQTSAELSAEEKDEISHRGQAMRAMMPRILA